MTPPSSGETHLVPVPGSGTLRGLSSATGLPADLLGQSATRLRTLALLYAFVFFMAGFFPALILEEGRAHLFSSFAMWGPGTIAIAVALVVAAIAKNPRVPLPVVMNIGLLFEIAGSYGIAAAEFLDPTWLSADLHWIGLSWVAVWILLVTVVVPAPPRRALVASLLSVTAVPIVNAIALGVTPGSYRPSALGFFFALIFPYLLVVIMAYVAARIIYSLGTEVSRARQLGSYSLVARLGQGGMGEVWRAEHRLLARPAAIKLIKPTLTTAAEAHAVVDIRRRFEREAQVIASLRSPHTVDLFDFGVSDDGAFYYVMELLDGMDAETLVRRFGPLPVERAIHVLQQLCHSLSEAEARHLVHRDIKPANIFLCRYGEEFDFVKVLDFGLVKAVESERATDSVFTREHVIHGTPAYIAPEQALGAPDLDGRVDIYSAGCVAYWLVTGQQVFTAETTMALLMHHAQTPPAPPSSRTELPIPRAFDELILNCLAKDRAARPQSAKELSRRLAAIQTAGSWTEADARGWWETNQPTGAGSARDVEPAG